MMFLFRFTRAERLESNEKFLCSHCNTYQEPIKQFSIHSLPIILCFHFKVYLLFFF